MELKKSQRAQDVHVLLLAQLVMKQGEVLTFLACDPRLMRLYIPKGLDWRPEQEG